MAASGVTYLTRTDLKHKLGNCCLSNKVVNCSFKMTTTKLIGKL